MEETDFLIELSLSEIIGALKEKYDIEDIMSALIDYGDDRDSIELIRNFIKEGV